MADFIKVANREANEAIPAVVKPVETEIQSSGYHRQVVKIGTPSSIGVGSKTIALTGVAVQLVAVSTPCVKVFMTAIDTNADKIYWGGSSVSSANGDYIFPAGKIAPIEIDDVSKIYINGTAGDGVKFTYLT